MNKIFYILPIISGLMTAVSQIILKKSAVKKHESVIKEYINPAVLIAYAIFFAVLLLNVFIYTKVAYKYGVVINSLSIIFVMGLSCLFLKEVITPKKAVGNVMILVGIICFSCF